MTGLQVAREAAIRAELAARRAWLRPTGTEAELAAWERALDRLARLEAAQLDRVSMELRRP